MIRFSQVVLNLRDRGTTETLKDMAGWRCPACSKLVLTPETLAQYAETRGKAIPAKK